MVRPFIIAVAAALLIGVAASAEETVYVQVRESKVRSTPKIWAAPVASVSYGDALVKLSGSEGWSQVKTAGGKGGYIPESSITSRKVVLSSNASLGAGGADSTDAILAGKGFDQATERQFAASSGANLAPVDQMEKLRISEQELKEFVISGGLEGGR